MAAPLSGQFSSDRKLATGMFGGVKQTIAPRGSYVIQGVGDPAMGYSGYGYYWGPYMSLTSGTSDFGQVSTVTGVPVGTPEASDTVARLNVGTGGMAPAMSGSSPV